MKKMIFVAALLVMFAFPVFAQDYCIDFYPVSLSGKEIDDGYYSGTISDNYWELVVCGTAIGDTSDYFYADLYDSDGNFWIEVGGHIVWSPSYKSAYIQGSAFFFDDFDNADSFYMDGTIKVSGSKFSFTMKGGETFSNDGVPWIALFTSVKASKGYLVDKDFKKDKGPRANKRGKNIWKKAE